MEEFAEYILNEEDLIAKEEIIYFLAPKLGINFDKSLLFIVKNPFCLKSIAFIRVMDICYFLSILTYV